MPSIIDTLITDRTQEDVDAMLALLADGINPADHKGAYNASDLNRVGEAIDYIKLRLYEAGIAENNNEFDIDYALPEEAMPLSCEQFGKGIPSPDNIRDIIPAIQLPRVGKIYSGTLDVPTGVLTVTHAGRRFSALTWTKNASANTFNGEGFAARLATIDGSGETGCFCDAYQWYKSTDQDLLTNYGIALAKTSALSTRIYVTDLRHTTVAGFVASFGSFDPLVVCPLAEPVTYQLTPQEIGEVAKQIGDRVISIKPEATSKTDWATGDIPTQSQLNQYLGTIRKLRGTITEYRPELELPETIRHLDYNGANQIEALLQEIDILATKINLSYRSYSGRQISGVNCLP